METSPPREQPPPPRSSPEHPPPPRSSPAERPPPEPLEQPPGSAEGTAEGLPAASQTPAATAAEPSSLCLEPAEALARSEPVEVPVLAEPRSPAAGAVADARFSTVDGPTEGGSPGSVELAAAPAGSGPSDEEEERPQEAYEGRAALKAAAEDGAASVVAGTSESTRSDLGVPGDHILPGLEIENNGNACSVEGELEALQNVVSVLAEQLRSLCEEAGVAEEPHLEDISDPKGASPDWDEPHVDATGSSLAYLVRWYVGRLTDRAAAGDSLDTDSDPADPSSSSRSGGAALEVDGAVHFAAELHAFEEWFSRGVSAAAVLLDKRDRCLRLASEDTAGRAGE